MLHHAGKLLLRRDEAPEVPDLGHEISQLPDWSVLVFLFNALIFLPVFLIINYTFDTVFPVLAIVEDEKPPAYDPLPVEPLAADDDMPKPAGNPSAPVAGQGIPITSSFRATWRLLRSHGGFRALFRGLPCLIAQAIVTFIISGALSVVLPFPIVFGSLIGSLLLVQLSTAWVHIVITPASPLSFWRRLPPFKTTFSATWRPVLIYWVATELANFGTVGIVYLLHLKQGSRVNDANSFGSAIGVLIVAIILQIALQIPAYMILVRVQASLLPADADTIIPFDRSFNGRIEPVVVGGLGYATVRDAWSSFSKTAWRRIVMIHVKVTGISIAASLVMVAVIVPQVILLASLADGSDNSGNEDMKM
ncbi:hypothetical protein NW762_001661 [Fusarium torreyae]|uniref:Ubiquitin carrier protein n=1 Tax=Fusarium torreyae TaxID=1237075 RepID=A0A9W8VK30_9HYPO|nr:hypothetical protein NW762_001661 [Fusarium torreyae]